MNNKIEKELYYRVIDANVFLVFARPRNAENVSKIYEALQTVQLFYGGWLIILASLKITKS